MASFEAKSVLSQPDILRLVTAVRERAVADLAASQITPDATGSSAANTSGPSLERSFAGALTAFSRELLQLAQDQVGRCTGSSPHPVAKHAHVQLQSLHYILQVLPLSDVLNVFTHVICGATDPASFFRDLSLLPGAQARCGTKWAGKHIAYRCKTCGVTSSRLD